MQWTRIQEGWNRIGAEVSARWTRLNASDVQTIDGDRDSLIETICKRYELPRDAVDWQISVWQNAYSDRWLYGGASERE
jgi:hypothetical protein